MDSSITGRNRTLVLAARSGISFLETKAHPLLVGDVHWISLAFHPSFHLQGPPFYQAISVFPRSKLSEAVEACQKEKHQAGDLTRGMVVVALARLSADRCVTVWGPWGLGMNFYNIHRDFSIAISSGFLWDHHWSHPTWSWPFDEVMLESDDKSYMTYVIYIYTLYIYINYICNMISHDTDRLIYIYYILYIYINLYM